MTSQDLPHWDLSNIHAGLASDAFREAEAFVEKVGFEETIALVEKTKAYDKTWEELPPETEAWLESTTDW